MSNISDHKATIWVVEDEPAMSRLITLYLRNWGYGVKTLPNGVRALNEMRQNQPDLIISDILMPKMDGLTLRDKLLKDPDLRLIPFIFLTAKGAVEERVTGLKMFVDDYIAKPFEPEELRARIETILNRYKYFRDQMHYDELTRLYNRKTFFTMLGKELKRSVRYNAPLTLAMLDIDYFKQCNDTYGHTFGDAVLMKVSDVLVSSLRDSDWAGRFGGEEFVVAMPETAKENGRDVVERLRRGVAELSFLEEPDFKCSISAGIASCPDDAAAAEELLNQADSALYTAKQEGRNRVCLFGLS